VRPARPEDRAAVLALAEKLWPDEPIDMGEDYVAVWAADGRIGGFVTWAVRPWADACEQAPCPYVEGWYVEEDLRRTGVGAALIAHVEAWARAHGFTELGSDALLENRVSIAAHHRLGFAPVEKLQLFRKRL